MNVCRTRFLIKACGLWLLGAMAISIPLSLINLVSFYHLKYEGVRTTGVVTELQPGNHQAVYYSYDAGGKTYSGIGKAGFGNPEFCCLAVGHKITIYYLPRDPFESCAGFPDEQ
jgi:hypothetical protein